MKILIIGVNSFIGSSLRSFYKKKNYKIQSTQTFFHSTKDRWIKDTTKKIIKGKPDIIFYCSAKQTIKDDQTNIKKILFTNCEVPCLIAYNILKYKILKSKFIFFGTSWENDYTGKYFPVNLYAASKKAAENLLTHYALKGVNIINFKLFDTYGENDRRKKFLNILVKSVLANQKLKITKGEQEINLTNVLDICQGLDLGIEQSKNWIFKKKGILKFYLGQNKVIKIKRLVKIIEKSLNKKSKIIFGGLKYRDREPMKTYKLFKKPKGWKIKNSLNEYLKKI
jgi:CDP-paratose synthetase